MTSPSFSSSSPSAWSNLAGLLQATNRLAEAEPLIRPARAIFEASLGEDHPNSQMVARNYQLLLAEMQNRKCKVIGRRRQFAFCILPSATNRLAQAELLMRRCLEITRQFHEQTGHEHSNSAQRRANYRALLAAMGLDEADIAARLKFD